MLLVIIMQTDVCYILCDIGRSGMKYIYHTFIFTFLKKFHFYAVVSK